MKKTQKYMAILALVLPIVLGACGGSDSKSDSGSAELKAADLVDIDNPNTSSQSTTTTTQNSAVMLSSANITSLKQECKQKPGCLAVYEYFVNYINQTMDNFYEIGVKLDAYGDDFKDIPIALYNKNKLIAKTLVNFETKSKVVNFTIPKEDFHGYVSISDTSLEYDKYRLAIVSNSNSLIPARVFDRAIAEIEEAYHKQSEILLENGLSASYHEEGHSGMRRLGSMLNTYVATVVQDRVESLEKLYVTTKQYVSFNHYIDRIKSLKRMGYKIKNI